MNTGTWDRIIRLPKSEPRSEVVFGVATEVLYARFKDSMHLFHAF